MRRLQATPVSPSFIDPPFKGLLWELPCRRNGSHEVEWATTPGLKELELERCIYKGRERGNGVRDAAP